MATKTVSWVPIAGWMLPNEKQLLRLRLKVAVIDTLTGQWSMFMTDPVESTAISGKYDREASDLSQIEGLKKRAYEAAVSELARTIAHL